MQVSLDGSPAPELSSSLVEVTVSDNKGERSFIVDEKYVTPRESRRRHQKKNMELSKKSPSHSADKVRENIAQQPSYININMHS